jgi:hypothetical protein
MGQRACVADQIEAADGWQFRIEDNQIKVLLTCKLLVRLPAIAADLHAPTLQFQQLLDCE